MNFEESSKESTSETAAVSSDEFYLGIAKEAWAANKKLRSVWGKLNRELLLGTWPFDCAKLDVLLKRVSMAIAEMQTHSEICKQHTLQPPHRVTERRKKASSRRRSGGDPEQNR